ncbi:TonB-dependent receptor [Paludibaculum fermentans]|uniref:TonB-dependent receptor n=1 Tax=Paludibaculum fermentans TaxID=1473598 RepID=A0A7S7NNG2_PALFE|nr:carboxypeptidase regulatory-like domain-containing protein [Paludibaculum fermentans]QOY86836.1 TonB-dependent receptor [Paludibaculum fermentans]
MQVRPIFLIYSISICLLSSAQETISHASVSGRVTDPSGLVVESAAVQARQLETNQASSTITSREGRFRFPYLRPGSYEVSVKQPGFAPVTQRVVLTVGAAFELPFELRVSGAETAVDVSSEASLVEAGRSQVAGTVPQAEVASLPLNGRNFTDIALLVPGVSPTNTASTQLFPETSAVPGQGISIASQRNFSNSFIVDGLSANDDAAGLGGMLYSVDAVNNFQVVTSGGQAEFGRALGGYINVITKSGTNQMHGDLYGYFRNQRFNASNALSATRLPLTQAQYGASLGGPILADRTFYFANFEQRNLNQSGLVTISPANVATINSRLDATGYQGPRLATGIYSNPVRLTNVIGKIDHQFRPADQFSLRFSLYDVSSSNTRGAGGLSASTAAAGLENTDYNLAASNILTLSPRLVNETRGQFTASSLAAEPNDIYGPSVSIAGVATFGRLAGSPTGRKNKLVELVDNVSYQAGTHALRAGGNFLYNSTTITYPRTLRGSYSFSSLANFLSGVYNNAGFTQTFGNTVNSQTNPNAGFYLQDEWKVAPRFTLNLGVRYDLQFLESIHTDTNNVSPRGGFAWSPFAARRTVVRGSFGLFYDRVPLRALANALLSSGNSTIVTPASQISVSLSPTQAGAPVFPNVIGALPASVLPNFSTMDVNMQNAYSTQGSLEVEQQLGAHGTLSVGYEHLRGLHLIVSLNRNVPTCVAAGTNNGCRPNPNYANNTQYAPLADSRYDGLHVSFVQRPSRWGSYRISYTYSKALANVGEFFFSSPVDQYNIWQDWGRSDDDQRHRVVFNGTIHSSMSPAKTAWQLLSHGFQLGGMLQYYSALPFNITAGSNTVQGTAARPMVNGAFIERNAGQGFDLFNLNARLSRAFQFTERLRMEAIAETFNSLNRANGVTLNGVFGSGAYPANPSSTFGQVTSVADSRTMQLALRISF